MKRFLIGLVAVAWLAGCGQTPAPNNTPPPPKSSPAQTASPVEESPEASPSPDEVDTSGWIEFEAPDQSFVVKLPQKPEVTSSSQESEDGTIHYHTISAVVGGDTYQVDYRDYSNPEAAQDAYEERLAELNAMASGEEEVELDGHPGVRFHLTKDEEDTFFNSIFVVEDRLYDILTVHEDDPQADPREVEAMVRSLRFRS